AVMTEITENTPMVMPSIVSAERSLFAPSDDHAILMISPNNISFTAEDAEFAEQNHKVASSLSPSTRRRRPCFSSSTLKLMSNPIFHPPQLQIAQQLGVVNRQQRIDCFNLNQDCFIHDNVCPVSAIESDSFVFYRYRDLSLKGYPADTQLSAYAHLISRFQQSGSEHAIDFHRSPDDRICQFVQILHSLCGLCVLCG